MAFIVPGTLRAGGVIELHLKRARLTTFFQLIFLWKAINVIRNTIG
jgi:ABC-type histidine transport system ATPase subunit